MKSFIKKFIPSFLIQWYHWSLSYIGTFLYGFPSNKLIVIGVTGTNGKSTVVNLIGHILKEAGFKVAWAATTNFCIDDREWLNDQKMTMLGRLKAQKFLKDSLKAGCKYAIIETSSEGIKQYRHLGINYDVAVFTNLTPEHIESHGSFENYKKAKGEFFRHLTKKPKKKIDGQINIDKTIVANADDKHTDYFLKFPADRKLTYSINHPSDFQATNIELNPEGSSFKINGQIFKTNLLGKVNIYNCLSAIVVAKNQNINDEAISQALERYPGMPGRFEFINKGLASLRGRSGQNFKVMVDYAPEPEAMKKLYETLKLFNFDKVIHVLGSCGGGRDKARRPILGKLAAENADVVVVTNEDPYDENPQEIINQVSQGAEENGKILNQNLFQIIDRKEAIKKALSLAQENAKSSEALKEQRMNLVLITGKGCEQFICVANGEKVPWDDRRVVRELLNEFY